jgi:hypothetical protein
MGERRRACDQCQGTDTQRECEQGQCYAEWSREHEERRRDAERENYYRHG